MQKLSSEELYSLQNIIVVVTYIRITIECMEYIK